MTETTAPVIEEPKPSAPAADPDKAAERIREKNQSSTERVRAYRRRQKGETAEPKKPPAEPVPITITEADVQEAAVASGIVWELAIVPFSKGRVRSLDEPQTKRLGQAMAPLIKKYLPMLAAWQYEIAAGLCIVSLVKECWVPEPPKETGSDEKAPATN